jgi:hypothetical protein
MKKLIMTLMLMGAVGGSVLAMEPDPGEEIRR